jgi:hypothetical protein
VSLIASASISSLVTLGVGSFFDFLAVIFSFFEGISLVAY